jgi:anti-anti-sigma factor
MKITEGEIRGLPLLVVDGDLDHSTSADIRDAVDAILRGAYPPQNLLIDLTDCAYLDSGGLGVLFTALRELPPGGWLGLIGVSPELKRILTYAGLLDIERLRFFSSPGDAAASLAREPLLPLGPDPGPPEYKRPPNPWERWEHGDPL